MPVWAGDCRSIALVFLQIRGLQPGKGAAGIQKWIPVFAVLQAAGDRNRQGQSPRYAYDIDPERGDRACAGYVDN